MSEFFIRRPIVAIVIAILMTLIGGVCILALPIAQYPQIAPPEIQVQTHYTGADALTIEQSVAAPIEQQMSGVDNMNYMYSINANSGDIRLIVNFDVATDPNIDHVLTQIRVSQAQSQLPADVINYGLTVKKSTIAPLMLIAFIRRKEATTEFFSPTTPTSILSTNSRAFLGSVTCRCSAPASMRCGSG
jgi:HAE1 family hydrophobic/amphiphilic exporter-1